MLRQILADLLKKILSDLLKDLLGGMNPQPMVDQASLDARVDAAVNRFLS